MSVAFVTGASGFVGRHLVRALVREGDQVRSLGRSQQSAEVVTSLRASPIAGDLEDDDALTDGMHGADVVYHLAARVKEWGALADFQRDNVDATARVVAAARRCGVPRVVFVSSEQAVAGRDPLVDVDETCPYPMRHASLYGRTKAAAERVALQASDEDLACVVVRLRYVWGRDDTSLLQKIVAAVRGGDFWWIDHGRHLVSTLHIQNAVDGLMLAAERAPGGEVFFLADENPVVLRDMLCAQLASVGLEPPSRSLGRKAAALAATASEAIWRRLRLRGTPPLTWAALSVVGQTCTVDASKAQRMLGYTPTISHARGFAEMDVDWAKFRAGSA